MEMRYFIQVLAILTILSCRKQSELTLNVNEKDSKLSEDVNGIKHEDQGKFFEDENFEVWRSCSGEWGGTIYFKDKLTNKIYGSTSTCPVSIDKKDSVYYISNNLNHMIGFSDILEIKNPKEMTELEQIPKYDYNSGVITIEYEAKSDKGTKKLVDSTGVAIISSFIANNELYSVITSSTEEKTTISKIQNGKFITVIDLSKHIIIKPNPLIKKENSQIQKIIFQHLKKSGILAINGDKIDLTLYEK